MNAPREAQLTLERACESAYDDVCRQLAFHSAGDAVSFDDVVLAYSLLTYVRVLETLGRQERAARERDSSARDAVGTGSPSAAQQRIIRAALALIFEVDTGGPGRRASRSCSRAARATTWAMRTCSRRTCSRRCWRCCRRAPSSPTSGASSSTWAGWRSTSTRRCCPRARSSSAGAPTCLPRRAVGWCTAQAVRCISRVRRLSRELLNADALRELGTRRRADVSAWARLLDSDLPTACSIPGGSRPSSAARRAAAGVGVGGEAGGDVADDGCEVVGVGPITLKATIEQRMIDPLAGLSGAELAAWRRGRRDLPARPRRRSRRWRRWRPTRRSSGPPGTAKTTVVAAIARRLGWAWWSTRAHSSTTA